MKDYNTYIETIDFGSVPVRKKFTDGLFYKDVEIVSYNDKECFAEVRIDYKTNQPFAVLFDGDWNQIL